MKQEILQTNNPWAILSTIGEPVAIEIKFIDITLIFGLLSGFGVTNMGWIFVDSEQIQSFFTHNTNFVLKIIHDSISFALKWQDYFAIHTYLLNFGHEGQPKNMKCVDKLNSV